MVLVNPILMMMMIMCRKYVRTSLLVDAGCWMLDAVALALWLDGWLDRRGGGGKIHGSHCSASKYCNRGSRSGLTDRRIG